MYLVQSLMSGFEHCAGSSLFCLQDSKVEKIQETRIKKLQGTIRISLSIFCPSESIAKSTLYIIMFTLGMIIGT